MTTNAHIEVDQLFRKAYGKIVSILVSRYGLDVLEMIENATMEAYYKALKTWPIHGTPDDPQAWLYRSAQNAYIDATRKRERRPESVLDEKMGYPVSGNNGMDEDVIDPELKLLFLICHPDLSQEVQLAFMLKTLSGLGDKEISRALMVSESAIKKRLLRARRTIKEKELKFEWPSESSLSRRIAMVHRALYLLFNEGFYSTHAEQWIRKDLCLEAMRLCKYLADHRLGNSDTLSLMSLMCYHISRYEGRLDSDGNVILLDEQDRGKWDPFFINLGHIYLEKSSKGSRQISKYQIEAFISAQHCIAKDIESTNWLLLKSLYEAVYKIEKSSLILLNLVIVHLHLNEIESAKDIYDSLSADDFKSNKAIYYMVGVELFSKLKDLYQIELLLENAIQSSNTEREQKFIKNKLDKLKRR